MVVKSRFRIYIPVILLTIILTVLIPLNAAAANQDNLLADASAALDDELYEPAEQYLRQYLSLSADPNQPETKLVILLARALHGQKRYPEMLDLLNKNRLKAETSSLAGEFSFWLAIAYYANRQWPEALKQTDNFENRYPRSALIPDIIRLRAKTLLNLGRNAEAINTLQQLIKEHKEGAETVDDQLLLGQMLADSDRAPEACVILEKMLVYPPNTRAGQKCRSVLGRVYLNQKQWHNARLAYEPLINQSNIPDDYRLQAIELLSEIAASQTNFNEALSILENGLRLAPTPSQKQQLSLRKGMLLLKMNKVDDGITLIHNYVSSQATNALGAKVQLELAQTLLAKGLPEKALVEFQNFLESFASQADVMEAYNGKGTALCNLARYHEAADAFAKAEEISKKTEEKAPCRYRMADALFAGGQFKVAAETYTQAAAMMPDTRLASMALFQTAECQLQMGNLSEAETFFWKIYDEAPENELAPRALLRIADISLQQNKLRAAEAIYTWIDEDYPAPWRARAIYGRGLVAYRSGRFDNALKYFDNTLLLAKPARAPVRREELAGADDDIAADAAYMGAWTCFMLNKTDEARNRFAGIVSAYRYSGKAPEALFRLGELDYNNSRYKPAENLFNQLATDYPQAPLADSALFWAGRSALMQNEFKRGRDYFSALIRRYPASRLRLEARYFQSVALCELGQFDAAILIFNEIIKQYPDDDLTESAALKKADCQFILGSGETKRYEEAINSYQLILDRPKCSLATRLQAKYKIGRCLEKLDQTDKASAQYLQVIYLYLQNSDRTPSCNLWFARAAFNAAAIMEEKQNWLKAANIYERVVAAAIPASRDAEERIAKLRAEHWLFFY